VHGSRKGRLIRRLREARKDPYRALEKPPEPTACPECGAVFRDGRWRWGKAPSDAPRSSCPACQRIRDDYPAGYVRIEGEFASRHREEIAGLIRNVEEKEKADHALNRIMRTREEDGALLVTTTDTHLARAIGEALRAAYSGELEHSHGRGENLVRVAWRR
jgi:NMD protein affecting ribosome stability and mRNA decay